VENSAAAALFPWRQLGALLSDEGLLTETELELALDEQRRTGRLLGQIVVDRGYVSAFSLARVLSAQHGVDLHEPKQPEPKTQLAEVPATWRPLGRLLVEKGLITKSDLAEALLAQRENQRLGELLVERGVISGGELARALGEQQGVELSGELETTLKPAPVDEPVYRVYSVTFRQGFQERKSLCEQPNFLEAADFAMEFVQDEAPEALEIERVHGVTQETVWTYSETRAAAAELAKKDLVDTFGFDPTSWNPKR
jgi:MSHA biogenesis protein MshE